MNQNKIVNNEFQAIRRVINVNSLGPKETKSFKLSTSLNEINTKKTNFLNYEPTHKPANPFALKLVQQTSELDLDEDFASQKYNPLFEIKLEDGVEKTLFEDKDESNKLNESSKLVIMCDFANKEAVGMNVEEPLKRPIIKNVSLTRNTVFNTDTEDFLHRSGFSIKVAKSDINSSIHNQEEFYDDTIENDDKFDDTILSSDYLITDFTSWNIQGKKNSEILNEVSIEINYYSLIFK